MLYQLPSTALLVVCADHWGPIFHKGLLPWQLHLWLELNQFYMKSDFYIITFSFMSSAKDLTYLRQHLLNLRHWI